jgi:aldehyde:ferredoxin oxidoreductase
MPPQRFYQEPPKTGSNKGQITKLEDVNRLLDIYYEQRRWDSNGLPKLETLEELGIQELVA